MSTLSTTQIRFPTRLWDTVLDKETDFDGILPEHCPDVIRLIRVDCTPYIDSCDVSGGKAVMNGRVIYDLLYEADRKNKLRFCSFTQEFRHTADLPKNDLEDLTAECTATCSKITCRMISPRKPSLRARLELHTVVTGVTAVNTLSVQPTEGVFFLKKTLQYDTPAETVQQEFHFDESLPLLQGEESIGEVVFGTVTVQPPQTTVTNGSILLKTNAVAKVLYETEDGEQKGYRMTVKSMPLTLSMDTPASSEDKRCAASLEMSAHSITPELDQYGESRLLKACFTIGAKAVLCGTQETEVADDLFSVDAIRIATRTETKIPQLAGSVDRSFTVDLKLAPEDPMFTALYDTTVRAGKSKVSPGDGGLELTGVLNLSVLGDSNEGVLHRDFSEEFVQFIPVELPEEPWEVSVEVIPYEILPTLHADGSISARAICNARILFYTQRHMTFLCDPVKETELPKEDSYAVAYFFPAKNDTLWTVAKKYRLDPAKLKADNPSAFDDIGRLTAGTKTVTVIKI